MTQAQVLDILKTGANVFVTGEPGAGKTHTINAYIAYLRKYKIEPAITASTGIAATHIGGMTIHSWSGIGIKQDMSPYELDTLTTKEYVVKRIMKTKVLIIDEISMLTPKMFSLVDTVCRMIKQNPEPFGGIQVICVGDFFQLPPIKKSAPVLQSMELFAEKSATFVYESDTWERLGMLVCYITEQHRQSDTHFLDLLSAILSNTIEEGHYTALQDRLITAAEIPEETTKLFSLNADVDTINTRALAELPGDMRTYTMSTYGNDVIAASLQKSCLSPELLQLKKDAVVLFTKNNLSKGFANGTQGVVIDFNPLGYPVVETKSGKIIHLEPMDWSIEDQGKIKATISQIPLRLAWAITVHKSQGMSLDRAVMDLSNVFEYGQGYVALSRVRSLKGLFILGINNRALEVHPQILKIDQAFRKQSDAISDAFTKMKKTELTKMHKNFAVAVQGEWK